MILGGRLERDVLTRLPELGSFFSSTRAPFSGVRFADRAHRHWPIVSARSNDDGLTWSSPERVVAGANREPVVGKLPNLLRLPGGVLALLTAHSKRGCFLYLSLDGAGRDWSEGHLITKVTGGNTSMIALDENHLLVFTPASGRISCWRVALR